jgi:hypothetical protein
MICNDMVHNDMIRYYLLIWALCATALVFPMESYADSLRFVIVQADGQVIAIPGKEFLLIIIQFLGFAGAVFAFGYFLRLLRYRIF